MKIKNMSAKPIYIGEIGVLPNDEKEIADSYRNHPVVKMYIRRGLVTEVTETKASGKIGDAPKTPAKPAAKSKASSKTAATKKEPENQNSEPPAAENQDEVQQNGETPEVENSDGENTEQNTETE